MSQGPGQSCPKRTKGDFCLANFMSLPAVFIGWLDGTSPAGNLEPPLTNFLPYSMDLQLELVSFLNKCLLQLHCPVSGPPHLLTRLLKRFLACPPFGLTLGLQTDCSFGIANLLLLCPCPNPLLRSLWCSRENPDSEFTKPFLI